VTSECVQRKEIESALSYDCTVKDIEEYLICKEAGSEQVPWSFKKSEETCIPIQLLNITINIREFVIAPFWYFKSGIKA